MLATDRVPNQGDGVGVLVCAMPGTKLSRVPNSSLGLDRASLPHDESPPRGESLGAGKTEIPRERLLPSCHSRGALHSLPRDGVRSGECRQTRPALIRMYSLDSAVDTDRRNLANRVKLRALARFHAGPDHVHSERCPVKRATFREEPGAIRILRERLAPVHF